jgi:biotin carboxylase
MSPCACFIRRQWRLLLSIFFGLTPTLALFHPSRSPVRKHSPPFPPRSLRRLLGIQRGSLIRGGSTAAITPYFVTPNDDDDMEQEAPSQPPTRAFILMDAFCPYHGQYLATSAHNHYPGTVIVHILSPYLQAYLEKTHPDTVWANQRMPDARTVDEWKQGLRGLPVVGVYCESDSGLEDAEQLRALLQVTCPDDPIYLSARRNKYEMIDTIGKAGFRVPCQKLCDSMSSTTAFASELFHQSGSGSGGRVVVKPFRGVASESVHLCDSLEAVEQAWQQITSTVVFGSQQRHTNVLVQEFLQGTEYCVDVVSRNGDHKVAAVWRYDKRPANGAPFCYFKTELVDQETDPEVERICEYMRSILTTLGIRFGLSHSEVIVTKDGPVLVEVNHRQHNMDFCPLTMACIGYNALDMTLDAYLGTDEDWDMYPHEPSLRAFGCMAHLVNYEKGILKVLHFMDDIQQLPSVFDCAVYEHFHTPGLSISPTVDIRSDAGWIQMIHHDKETLDEDFEQIVQWMPYIFEVEG